MNQQWSTQCQVAYEHSESQQPYCILAVEVFYRCQLANGVSSLGLSEHLADPHC